MHPSDEAKGDYDMPRWILLVITINGFVAFNPIDNRNCTYISAFCARIDPEGRLINGEIGPKASSMSSTFERLRR